MLRSNPPEFRASKEKTYIKFMCAVLQAAVHCFNYIHERNHFYQHQMSKTYSYKTLIWVKWNWWSSLIWAYKFFHSFEIAFLKFELQVLFSGNYLYLWPFENANRTTPHLKLFWYKDFVHKKTEITRLSVGFRFKSFP